MTDQPTPPIPPGTPTALVRAAGSDDGSLTGRYRYAKAIAGAGDVVPVSLWDHPRDRNGVILKDANGAAYPKVPSPGKVLAVTEVARMLGFHPLAGLMGVYIIEGKPSLSAAIMSAKIRTAGHRLRVGTTGRAEDLSLIGWATLTRSDDPDFEYRVEWSLYDAFRAGLGKIVGGKWDATKDNWRKYPRAMLKARAIAEVIREAAEDELMGAAYLPDELGANTDEDGAPVDAPTTAPTRDWAADIAALRNMEAAAILREELRNAPDYSAELWGILLARVGVLANDEAVYEADGTPSDADEPPRDDEREAPADPEVPAADDVPAAAGPVADEDVVDAEVIDDAADGQQAPQGDEYDAEVLAAFPDLTDAQRAGIANLKRKSAQVTANVRPGGTA